MSLEITIGDLSTLKVEGAHNLLVLNPDTRKVSVTATVGAGQDPRVFLGRDMVLGSLDADVVEDSLREWLQGRLEEVKDIAEGYLGSGWDSRNNRVGLWSEDAHEAAEAFAGALEEARHGGGLLTLWPADDWCAGDWPSCEEAAGRAADLEDWASKEASDALASGIVVDEADLVKTMTARLTRKLAGLQDAVLIEWMPESLREAHTAAGNSGEYPHNGAERFVACRDEWEDLAEDEDEGQWVRIVRTATLEDLRVYGSR